MKAEHVQWDEQNHREEREHKDIRDDLVGQRLSLLERATIALVEQRLVAREYPHHGCPTAGQNHDQKNPCLPPSEGSGWQEEQSTPKNHGCDRAADQFEH